MSAGAGGQSTLGDDASAVEANASQSGGAPATHRRRRLWHLPADVHDVLLGLALPADRLRRLAESAASRVHGRACRLAGSDADLLYSVVHDLATRNPLSEAVDRHLSQVFAPECRDARRARDAEALRRWWSARPAAAVPVGAAWAALAHPLGATLQSRVRFELTAWAWTRARAATAAEVEASALRRRAEDLSAAVERHRERTLDLQRELDRRTREQGSRQAALAGELAAWRARAEAAETRGAAAQPPRTQGDRPVEGVPMPDAAGGCPTGRPAPDVPRGASAASRPPGSPDTSPSIATPAATDAGAAASGGPPPGVAGLRVLCVGGVRHAVSRYREHAERLGARFEHHDGGVEDALPRLDGWLGRADLVVCQAGCINHEAYHRIKRHCARQGTACVFLERPSVARFALALGHHLPVLAARRSPVESAHAG